MKIVRKFNIRLPYLVLARIFADLMGIHAYHRHFDGTHKIEIVETEVESRNLDLFLGQTCCVVGSSVKDRLSSSYSSLLWDQVEIEDGIALLLNQGIVHTGS